MNSNIYYTTRAICKNQKISQRNIDEMVSWGIAAPSGASPEKWLFSQNDYERIARAQRFRVDLKVNIPGAALALELLDEVQKMRNKEL